MYVRFLCAKCVYSISFDCIEIVHYFSLENKYVRRDPWKKWFVGKVWSLMVCLACWASKKERCGGMCGKIPFFIRTHREIQYTRLLSLKSFLKKISFTFPLFLVFNQAIVSKFFFFVKGENTFIQTFSLTELSFLEQKMILRNMHVTCLQV